MSDPDPFKQSSSSGFFQSLMQRFRGPATSAPPQATPPQGIDDLSAVKIAQDVYHPQPGATGDWQRQSEQQIADAGLDPELFKSKTGAADYSYYKRGEESVVAAPGTVFTSKPDWMANYLQASGQRSEQHAEFVEVVKQVKQHDGDNLVALVGHSKGGAAVTLAGEVHNVPVVTANSARLHEQAPGNHGYTPHPQHDPGKNRNFVVDNEPLDQLQGALGRSSVLSQWFKLREKPDSVPLEAPPKKPVDHPSMRQHVQGLDPDFDSAMATMKLGDEIGHSVRLHGSATLYEQMLQKKTNEHVQAAKDSGLERVDRILQGKDGQTLLVQDPTGLVPRYATVPGQAPGGNLAQELMQQINRDLQRPAPTPDPSQHAPDLHTHSSAPKGPTMM